MREVWGKGLCMGKVLSERSPLCAHVIEPRLAHSQVANTTDGRMVGLFTHGADSMLTQLNLQSQRRILCYGSNRAKDSVLTRGNNI